MGEIQIKGNSCPRLIEVALPIREISAESVRDKSLRQGHISTLHLWWARRPLAASRAVVFASLVPDPDDPACPKEFKIAVEKFLKKEVPSALQVYYRGRNKIADKDPYRPYEGMPDTLRNRLLCFVAKWSPEAIAFEKGTNGKEPKPAELLDDRSLVKWETSDPENAQGREVLRIARELVKLAHNGKTPTVIDPFAGGGAIPLEAVRLGAQVIANDYNPVAYLILRATCEFPQKYGKPGQRKTIVDEFGKRRVLDTEVPNVLIHDIEHWANWILGRAKEKIGHLYPSGKDGSPIVGYLWARTAPCSNPSCRGDIPLLRSLVVCDLRNGQKRVALIMDVDKITKKVQFGIAKDKVIKQTDGTMQNRGNVLCPFCNQITPVADLRTAGLSGTMGECMVAVMTAGRNGKEYRAVEDCDVKAYSQALSMHAESPNELILPEINSDAAEDDISNSTGIRVHLYGMKTWGSLFNRRQLVVMQTFIKCLHDALLKMRTEIGNEEYRRALVVYLGLWISRIAQRGSSAGIWHTRQETFEHPFGRQAIPMNWDYPEANPLLLATNGVLAVSFMSAFLKREALLREVTFPAHILCTDAATISMPERMNVELVVTDPPYFDAIAYGDLSDYFYIWLKRALADEMPEVFMTPLTPKSEEATSLKHRHNGNDALADEHYQQKLTQALRKAHALVSQNGLVSIMFAHQSTKAWTALIRAIFNAGMTIDASWPIDTEKTYALKNNKSVLSSSITVICRSRNVGSATSFKDVRKEIEKVVHDSVKRFWSYGLRGADLIVACYGPAVGVFGRYERVEKSDGTPVEIPELLEFARQAARDAIAGEFKGDNLSTLYYVWANLYGSAEQAWDDARLVVQIGGDADDAMQIARSHGIFVVDGSKCRLALLADRANKKGLGVDPNPPLIDALHHALLLWKEERRSDLVAYLSERGLPDEDPFWKLAQALFEVLPHETEDWKLVHALLGERETLRTETKRGTKTGGLF